MAIPSDTMENAHYQIYLEETMKPILRELDAIKVNIG